MANDLSGINWTFDTASTSAAQWLNPVIPLLVTWKPNAADDVLVIKNKNGLVLLQKKAITGTPAGDEVWDKPTNGRPVDGFWVYTLTSGGTLEVLIAA